MEELPAAPAAKRARAAAPPALARVGAEAAAAPAAWAPVAAAMLLRHAHALPGELLEGWARALAAALPAALAAGGAGALWALRYAHALALAAPPPPPAAAAPGWPAVWAAAAEYAAAPGRRPAELDAALWALAAVADRGLAPPPPDFHRLWGVPLLAATPSPAGVAFAAAALRAGADSAAHAGQWEGGVLAWLARPEAAADPAAGAAAALEAFLRLPPSPAPPPGAALDLAPPGFGLVAAGEAPAWAWWWAVDEVVERQLAALTRGAAYMRARAAAAARAAKRTRWVTEATAAAAARAPAGAQMHAQAAAALEAALRTVGEADEADGAEGAAPPAHGAPSSLTRRLAATAAALAVAARAVAATGGKAAAPACWRPCGGCLGAVRAALADAGAELAAACRRLDGLAEPERAALAAFAAAAEAYQLLFSDSALEGAVAALLPPLEETFGAAAPGTAGGGAAAAAATQAAGGAAGAAAAFDDELDVGGVAAVEAAGAGRGAAAAEPAVSSAAALVEAARARVAAVLLALARAAPVAAGAAAARMAGASAGAPGRALPPALHLALVRTAVASAAAAVRAGCPEAPTMAADAAAALGGAGGVLAWEAAAARPAHPTARFAMDRAAELATALAAAPAAAAPGARAALGATRDAVAAAMALAARRPPGAAPGGARARVALGRAVAALFAADARLFPADGGLFDAAFEAVAALAWDDAHAARLAGGRLLQPLLRALADPARAFAAVRPRLGLAAAAAGGAAPGGAPPAADAEERAETGVCLLAEVAAAVGPLELEALLLLAREAAAAPRRLPLAAAALDWAAAELGYADRFAYAAWHHGALVHAWFVAGGGDVPGLLRAAPLLAPDAAAARSPRAFAAAAAPALAATLVALQDVPGLAALAAAARAPLPDLLARHLDAVLALAYPGSMCPNPSVRDVCAAALHGGVLVDGLGGPADLAAAMGRSVVGAVGLMLAAARDAPPGAPPPALPHFPPAAVVAAVRALPSAETDAEKEALLWGRLLYEDQVAALLLQVQEHLGRARHPRHLAAAVGAVRAALLLLGDRVARPATFRAAAALLLRLLRVPSLRGVAAVMLRDAASRALADPSGAGVAALGAELPAAVATLADAVAGAGAGGASASDATQLVSLLEGLTANAPPELRPFLRTVDPLPGGPALAAAAAAVAAGRRGATAAEQLTHLAARAAGMPPALRRRSLAALRAALAADRGALFEGGADAVAGGRPLRARPEVAAAAWRLAVLSNDLADARLAEFAGELLAVVGPLPPGTIAFDAAALGAPPAPAPAGGAERAAGAAADAWVAALRLLCDYAVEEDTAVVAAAQAAARRLLAAPAGRAALARLEPRARELVGIFAPAGAAGEAPRYPGAPDSRTAPAEARALWRLGGQPHGRWASALAHAMLRRADDPMLHHCAALARLKPAFAELLLPLAFADLALHEEAAGGAGGGGGAPPADARGKRRAPEAAGSDSAAARVAAAIAAEVLPHAAAHPKAARLLLRCLNHLRGLRLDAMAAPAPPAGAPPAGPRFWSHVYWVELDYLEVAAAAARCRAHFSALLYVEAWAEAAGGGRLRLPPPRARGRAAADALLLEVYSAVEEPDGLYGAAAADAALLPQLRRFEREGDWAQALVTADLALQLLGDGGGGNGGANGAANGAAAVEEVGGLAREAAEAGRLRSLSHLGAASLLATAAAARGGSAGAGGAALDAAAALGEWAPLDAGRGGAAGGAPADAALAGALAALAAGAAESCAQALAAGRRGLVAALATAGLEGAGDANPALVRLQMLQTVAEAWEARWPELPDLGTVGSPNKAARRLAASASDSDAGGGGGGAARRLGELARLWRAREAGAGAGGRYELLAPLQGLRRRLAAALDDGGGEAAALFAAAVAARKAGHHGQAAAALWRLRALATRGAAAGAPWALPLAAPRAGWRVEEAKLLWARGQQRTALAVALRLLADRGGGAGAGDGEDSASGATGSTLRLSGGGADDGGGLSGAGAYLTCLTAKWMAACRENEDEVFAMMQAAGAAVQRGADGDGDGAGSLGDALGAGDGAGGAAAPRHRARILYRLAHYADTLYRGSQERRASPEWARAGAVVERKAAYVDALRAQRAEARPADAPRIDLHIARLSAVLAADRAERAAAARREVEVRRAALAALGACLLAGDEYDLPAVFRLVQLWLSLAGDADAVTRATAALGAAPSRKLLPLVHQVASRLSAPPRGGVAAESGFQAGLRGLLERAARDHPFHVLPVLVALANGDRGADGRPAAAAAPDAAGGGMAHVADAGKVAAARAVLAAVAAGGGRGAEVVAPLAAAAEAYVELASVAVPRERVEPMALPAGFRRRLLRLAAVPVLTLPLPVDPTGQYADVPYVAAVGDSVRFVGGINKPKLLEVTDSTGARRRQLVKGGQKTNDDLRQDAVMQQFFGLLNAFLADDGAAAARALRVRTYRVVPLSPAAGLLEWVDDTLPLSEYLIGEGGAFDAPRGAHNRYRRRGDWTIAQAYGRTATAHTAAAKGEVGALRTAWDEVAAKFPPVLHNFFLERFRDPGAWFAARLAYTRSVAAASMAGHVIGLGDRHSSNILVDAVSAEVVHIDLGIAFEQGRFLRTPEVVPFRLTRDLVDGFGAAGLEGAPRRCCQVAMRVCREHADSILTVLEVFLHDPLYNWALTPTKLMGRQRGGGGAGGAGESGSDDEGGGGGGDGAGGDAAAALLEGNADAERTLLRIRQKLEGAEGGGAGRSVEAQVAALLAEATEPDRLCRLYIGWLAFL